MQISVCNTDVGKFSGSLFAEATLGLISVHVSPEEDNGLSSLLPSKSYASALTGPL